MFRLIVKDFTQDDWSRLVEGFEDLSLMQCWEYAEAKTQTGPWRVERGVFLDGDGAVAGAFQGLVRPLPLVSGGLMWINRGPLWRFAGVTDTEPLMAMMAELRRHYADGQGMYLRIAPPVAHGALAPVRLREAGLSQAEVAGWASAVLDLSPPLETMRKGLRQKWRNSLNKAERLDLEVRSGTDQALFAVFLESHARLTAERRFHTTVTAEFLDFLQALQPDGRRMEVFVAFHEDRPVGSVLVAKYGSTSEYLAGHTTEAGRWLNAGRLLLWRAVAAMKEQRFRRFDVGGMDPDLTPAGIWRFKEGLGGTPYRLARELEATGGGLVGRLVRWRVRNARMAA